MLNCLFSIKSDVTVQGKDVDWLTDAKHSSTFYITFNAIKFISVYVFFFFMWVKRECLDITIRKWNSSFLGTKKMLNNNLLTHLSEYVRSLFCLILTTDVDMGFLSPTWTPWPQCYQLDCCRLLLSRSGVAFCIQHLLSLGRREKVS